jgi:tripartite-type tricarboxylate transporter receptor subunit TctC
MVHMTASLTVSLAVSLVAADITRAHAADAWPERPVRVILSFGAANGSPDLIARRVAPRLTEQWGRQVVIDPRAGAGGILGTEIASKAPPDGYTMVVVSPAHAINPSLHSHLPYDSVKDFEPVTKLADVPNILIVYPGVAARTVQELAALVKDKPGSYSYGSAGVGSSQHLAGELFSRMANVRMVHVPYKGGAAVVVDLVAGRVNMTFGSATSLPSVRAGRLRALAVTTLKRSPALPELPTIDESGYPGYEAAAWYGLLVPAHTPRAIVDKLHRDFAAALMLPEIRTPLIADTIDTAPSASPEAFRQYLAKETAKWGALVKESGAKSD